MFKKVERQDPSWTGDKGEEDLDHPILASCLASSVLFPFTGWRHRNGEV
jgi:hypothetical protein